MNYTWRFKLRTKVVCSAGPPHTVHGKRIRY